MARKVCSFCGEPAGFPRWEGTLNGGTFVFVLCGKHFDKYPEIRALATQ